MVRRIWGLIPCAGAGVRFGSDLPKQYARLGGLRVIDHVLDTLVATQRIQGIVVGLAANDQWWEKGPVPSDVSVWTYRGGATRAETVRRGLEMLIERGERDSWVLVHDAARPLVHAADIVRLIETINFNPQGGLLARPVVDTLKTGTPKATVSKTLDRTNVWRAQTPQLFPIDPLWAALVEIARSGESCTDEAQAMERAGFAPLLVEGSETNLKITSLEDLEIGEALLAARRPES